MDKEKIKKLIDVGEFQGELLYFTANLDGDFLFSFEHPAHSYGVFIPLYNLEALVSDLEFFCQGKSKYPPKKGEDEIFRGDVLNIEKTESHLYLRILSELIFLIMIPSGKQKALSRDFFNLFKHVKTKVFPVVEEEVQILN